VCWFYGMTARLGIATTLSACSLPLAAAILYRSLLCPLLFIAEQIRIALEHAGFVSGDLHAILRCNGP
jgi:hypothetical protein